MKRAKLVSKADQSNKNDYKVIKLSDFSQFKEKINIIKTMKKIHNEIDELEIMQVLSELEYEGRKMKPKRIKKIFKALVEKKIKEIQ